MIELLHKNEKHFLRLENRNATAASAPIIEKVLDFMIARATGVDDPVGYGALRA